MNGDFLEHYFTNNLELKSEMRVISYEEQSDCFAFLSDNGVFSKSKIDYGSRLLIKTILNTETRNNLTILDVGCGYGFLGVVLAKKLDSEVVMCDVNKRALHLAEQNRLKNKIRGKTILSNSYEKIEGRFDLIITNPPIRAGKEVVLNILTNAKEHLKEEGSLWFVIRKDQGAKSIIKKVLEYGECEILEKSKGFYIVRAKFS